MPAVAAKKHDVLPFKKAIGMVLLLIFILSQALLPIGSIPWPLISIVIFLAIYLLDSIILSDSYYFKSLPLRFILGLSIFLLLFQMFATEFGIRFRPLIRLDKYYACQRDSYVTLGGHAKVCESELITSQQSIMVIFDTSGQLSRPCGSQTKQWLFLLQKQFPPFRQFQQFPKLLYGHIYLVQGAASGIVRSDQITKSITHCYIDYP